MSRSLWTIAELSFRQIFGDPTDENKNTLAEFVETAKDEFSTLAFQFHLNLKGQFDNGIIESLLKTVPYPVQSDDEGLYIELGLDILTLPYDMGVYKVQPLGQAPLIKGSKVSLNLYENDPSERIYYREENKLRFPEGFHQPNTKTVLVTLVSFDFVDGDLMVPDIFAAPIRDKLNEKYGGRTVEIPADMTNNKNANN